MSTKALSRVWGEIDYRDTSCAVNSLHNLNKLLNTAHFFTVCGIRARRSSVTQYMEIVKVVLIVSRSVRHCTEC